ncbi:hypothetical protein FBEOM_10115 [Fusarium beomiforme]|uniref:Uncharacterized protein n=1 Tax=Fusarium beomiforme TaxID=44412 RepID=A0A9P5ABZ4_9HYPO|nr:hypothetical protein FBEOM_10115 [Fusarium beomiforme]
MDFKKRIAILVPIDVQSGFIGTEYLKSFRTTSEGQETINQLSTGLNPVQADEANAESPDEITEEGVEIILNPHPGLSIAHDLIAFLLGCKAVTSHLFRRYPIPSDTPSQPFPRSLKVDQWTPWVSFALSKSRQFEPGSVECSTPMKAGDIEVLTVSNSKFVQLTGLLAGDDMLISKLWEMPDDAKLVSPLLESLKPDFSLVEERGQRVIAWRVHGLDVSYYMDRHGYCIPGMVWPLEKNGET